MNPPHLPLPLLCDKQRRGFLVVNKTRILHCVKTTARLLQYLLLVTVTAFLCRTTPAGAAEEPDTVRTRLRVLVAPILSYSTDDGMVFGALVGVARSPGLLLFANASYGTKQNQGIVLEGRVPLSNAEFKGKAAYRQTFRELFDPVSADPTSEATVQRLEINLAYVHRFSPVFDFGPDLEIDVSEGRNVKNLESSLPGIPRRFRDGSVLLAGLRARVYTTDPFRPLHGFTGEAAVRGGRAAGDAFAVPRPDMAGEAMLSWTQPLGRNVRIYLRGRTDMQLEAPPPVRNHVGGESSIRGQPIQRDFGRRIFTTRTQAHFNVIRGMNWPYYLTPPPFRSMLPILLTVETVLFHDMGVAGDPDFGWRRSRHGFGAGLRVVLPPDLVARLDIARSPEGWTYFYIGIGETL